MGEDKPFFINVKDKLTQNNNTYR